MVFLTLAVALGATVVPKLGLAQIFFQSKQSFRQAVSLEREREVVVECTLPEERVQVQRAAERKVVLQMSGRFSIAGYHGSREDAGVREIAGDELAFRVSRAKEQITLASPEWAYIHHALLIDQLTITLPTSTTLKYVRIPDDELEGRR